MRSQITRLNRGLSLTILLWKVRALAFLMFLHIAFDIFKHMHSAGRMWSSQGLSNETDTGASDWA